MSHEPTRTVMTDLDTLFRYGAGAGLSDGQLLQRPVPMALLVRRRPDLDPLERQELADRLRDRQRGHHPLQRRHRQDTARRRREPVAPCRPLTRRPVLAIVWPSIARGPRS